VARFFFKDTNALPVNNSNPNEEIPNIAPQLEESDEAAAPTAASNVTEAAPATEPPTEAPSAYPPEGTWLVTPENGTTCDSNMSPSITAPFNVTVNYDEDATTLIIEHPEGTLAVDQQETSPTVIYTGADAIAQYELKYANDGTMSITETIAISGSPCVILYGSMEYQGAGE